MVQNILTEFVFSHESQTASPVSYVDIVFNIPSNQVFAYRMDTPGENLGKRVMVPFGKRKCLGYIIKEQLEAPAEVNVERIKAIYRIIDKEPVFNVQDIKLAEWMAAYYFCSLGQALAAMIPSGRRSGNYSTFSDNEYGTGANLVLSAEQQSALEAITAPLQIENPQQETSALASPPMFYVYGITGSGKTEVFLRAAEFMLNAGKSVLYLVPEISLTHQTAELIKERFGTISATLHSGMSSSTRLAEWMRIRRGEVRIVTGPRSAVFAPVHDLGLIIIDEEQDGSYKSGSNPRYHARQVAMHRCSAEKAQLVMGSATPSVEAWKLMQEGRIKRLDLTRRLSGGSIPEITTVSLEHTNGCITKKLQEEIRKTAQMGRQTILFLNHRGFAYFYHCSSCGFELVCRNCSVSLTYHKSKNRAICHYCGYQTVPPKVCPQCGSLGAGYTGFGTEMIEDEVRRTFPDLRLRRIDSDTTTRKGSLEETLDIFKAGGFDILLGTQMVAKGLNFPRVRLVGVILADTGLHLPDFRAAERTFSLIVQVAGRSGRYFPDGKVIVQTMRPDDPAITHACALDVEGFFSAELDQRKTLKFPPYTRLIRFTIRAKEEERAERAINNLAVITNTLLPPNSDILGPAECPIGIISGNHRYQIIVRSISMRALHGAVRNILNRYEKVKDSRVYLEIDVDPVSLL